MTEFGAGALSPDELRAEATRLLNAGWDMSEVAEALDMPVAQGAGALVSLLHGADQVNDAPPLNAVEVVRYLTGLAEELSGLVRQIGIADRQATHAREQYILARAVAFRQASGAVNVREAVATEVTHPQRLAAEEAECRVRDLRRRIDAVKIKIDVGRSYGAAVRAETVLLNSPFQEHA